MGTVWNGAREPTGEAILRIEGIIVPDECTDEAGLVRPLDVSTALRAAGDGDITVWINSEGGDYDAGAIIYSMLKEHNGYVTVKIDALAASAGSIIAMGGDEVLMSPAARMMIHRAATCFGGNALDAGKTQQMLQACDDSMVTVYAQKTGLSADAILVMMTEETFMSAVKAVKLGFADGLLYVKDGKAVGVAACVATAEKLYVYAGRHETVGDEADGDTGSEFRAALLKCVNTIRTELGDINTKMGGF